MFAVSFLNGEFLSSHWMVVIVTGLAFFAVQLVLCTRFYLRMRHEERALKSLCPDFEPGSGNLQQLRSQTTNSEWVAWVTANYAADPSGAATNLTRDDALQELDARIASSGDYLLLQRMGVMAPLLGVVLTVIGFYWLEIGNQEQSLQAILLAVAPLVSGVGTGAVLALINQALLHVAGHRAESLRWTARKWFDTVIWSQVDLDARAATGRAVTAMNQLHASLGEASSNYTHGASQLHASTASIDQAASQFREVVQAFSAEIKDIPAALHHIRQATTTSSQALDELIRVGSRAVSNLDVSVAAFRSTIDREFSTAARLQHRSGRVLNKSAKEFQEATERIRAGSRDLQDTAHANQASFERMDESIRKHMLPGHEHLHNAVHALTGRVNDFSHQVGSLSTVVQSVAGQFNQITGSASSNAILQEMLQVVRQSRETHQALAQAAGNLSEVGNQLRQSMKHDATASLRNIDDLSTSLARITQQLSEFASAGLDPATRRLVALHDTLASFEAALDANDEFGDERDEIEDGDDEPTDEENSESRTGFMAWLARRPR